MLDLRPPYPFWSVWPHFSFLQHLSLVVLVALIVYAVFSLLDSASWIRRIKAQGRQHDILAPALVAIRRRASNLNKLQGAAFYLFGMALFSSLLYAHQLFTDSSIPAGVLIQRNFQIDFIFGLNSFAGLMILHALQWVFESSVDRWVLKTKL